MALEDYGALLRSGAASVPDYAEQEARNQLRQLQISQERRAVQQQQQEVAEEDAFKSDLTNVLANPTAQGITGLILKHPKYAQQVKQGWDTLDKARQDSDLRSMSEVYSAAANGKYDLAAELVNRRMEADKAAGHPPDPHDQAILDGLKSGDPVQQKGALGMVGVQLSAVTGPDKFEQTYGALTKSSEGFTLTPGSKRFDAQGNLIAEAPAGPQYREVHEVDENGNDVTKIIAIGGGGGPASAAPGSAAPLGKVSPAMATVASTLSASGMPAPVVAGFMGNFHAEGGYEGAQGDGGSASGIAQWRNERAANFKRVMGKLPQEATHEEQARFVAYEMQHPEEAGMTPAQRDQIMAAKTPAQAAALIDKFYERSSGRDRKVRMSAANAFAGIQGDAGSASSGPSVVYQSTGGKKGEQYAILTPQEAQAQNLDPAMKWQKNLKTGQITALGGQSKQAKQIPQQVQTKVQPSIDTRDTFARLAGTWKPEYAGHTVLGDNLNTLQRTLGSWSGAPEGMAAWWADFQAMDNMVRNQLFGSALTEHEKAAYASTTITPRMDPKEVVRRFNVRRNIANAVAARQQNFLKKNGYDPEAVDAMFDPLGGGGSQRTVVRTGRRKSDGAKVVQYSDGTIEVGK